MAYVVEQNKEESRKGALKLLKEKLEELPVILADSEEIEITEEEVGKVVLKENGTVEPAD